MKEFKIFGIFLLFVFTVGLFMFEINFAGELSVRLGFDWRTRQRNQPIIFATLTEREDKTNNCPTTPIARAEAVGRLGNQIATYVNHIALQWEYGYKLYLSNTISTNMRKLLNNVTYPTSSKLDKCNISFWPRAKDWVAFTNFLARENVTCRQKTNETFDKDKFVDTCIRKQENEDLHIKFKTGHNKPDWVLLKPHMPDIMKYHLQMNTFLAQQTQHIIKEEINSSNKETPVLIGVHIRRGDFGGYTRFGHQMIDEKYYQAGLDYYRAQYNTSTIFLLVSDDMEWCREKFSGDDVFLMGGSSPEEDLALLSSCNHTLIGYGTFGLWGGVLAGGEVVIPKSIELYKGTASETAARVLGWTLLPGF